MEFFIRNRESHSAPGKDGDGTMVPGYPSACLAYRRWANSIDQGILRIPIWRCHTLVGWNSSFSCSTTGAQWKWARDPTKGSWARTIYLSCPRSIFHSPTLGFQGFTPWSLWCLSAVLTSKWARIGNVFNGWLSVFSYRKWFVCMKSLSYRLVVSVTETVFYPNLSCWL